ncbi:MAG TPA: patatin-like phospholipase family protein [Ktedonobacteraceae bacterium]|nr:patatin-like phospholipase family protein [Ktedonobacteraceae bacterium]
MNQQGGKVDGVFEGGGVKGIGLVGALSVFEEKGYEFVNVAGTSAGAIVAALLAAGYTADELKKISMSIGFSTFTDPPLLGHIPFVGPVLNEIMRQGLYKGDALREFIRDLLAKKGVHTFGDLILPEYADKDRYRFKLRVVASDITRRRKLVLPQDIKLYGMTPEDLDVSLAVRMSISIPFFFEPIKLKGSYIVDGGLLSNFPVEIFDSEGSPPWPTFGIKLVDEHNPIESMPHMINNPIDELAALFFTAIEAPSTYYLENDKYVRTTKVDTLGIMTTDFNLSLEQKVALYDSGVHAARQFLEHWDFAKYIAEFRRQPTPSPR